MAKNFVKISEHFDIEDSIPHYINAISNLLRVNMNRELEAYNLTWQQLAILMACHNEGGACSATQLAKILALDLPSTTRLIDRLVAKKLISRNRSTSDRRSIVAALTDGGRKILKRASHTRAVVLDTALATLTSFEKKTLTTLLAKMLKYLMGEDG